MQKPPVVALSILAVLLSLPASADVVGDVHDLALRTARAAGAAPSATNTLTLVDLAMFDAANAIERRYEPYHAQPAPPAGADPSAAALGAGCAVILALHPSQQLAVGAACEAIAEKLPASAATTEGRKFGEATGTAQVASRKGEGLSAPSHYRPFAVAGVYVPTNLPIGHDAITAKPFALTSPSQFRPGPPPALTSDVWTRDYNEVKVIGARNSTQRSPEQTATAQFWASSGPQQFLDSVSGLPPIPVPGVVGHARFLALLFMTLSDARIAYFDAKYAYNFWRPITAIRNGDIDGNDATERDESWLPLVDTPLHPEYPCAHCSVGAAFATVVASYLGDAELEAPLTLKPATAAGRAAAARSWKRVAEFVTEVADARVWGGLHYRNSTAAGTALGNAVGHWVITTQLRTLPATR